MIGVTITLIFHNIFSSLARSRNLSSFFLSFIFTLHFVGMANSTLTFSFHHHHQHYHYYSTHQRYLIIFNRSLNDRKSSKVSRILFSIQANLNICRLNFNNTGILNTCTRLWLMESEQVTPVDSIKDVVWSSMKVPEFDKYLKKARGHIGQNVLEIAIKMKAIVRKPLMIKN